VLNTVHGKGGTRCGKRYGVLYMEAKAIKLYESILIFFETLCLVRVVGVKRSLDVYSRMKMKHCGESESPDH